MSFDRENLNQVLFPAWVRFNVETSLKTIMSPKEWSRYRYSTEVSNTTSSLSSKLARAGNISQIVSGLTMTTIGYS